MELLSDDEDGEAPLAAQPGEERSEVEPGAELRPSAVHVYGAETQKDLNFNHF